MRKQNGFVFMETIVVVSVLSLVLIILFTSYSFILRKSRERNTFDTTEMIYKTYYINDIIKELYPVSGISAYKSTGCKSMGKFSSYVCDLSSDSYNGELIQVKEAFEVEKIYFLTPRTILTSPNKTEWLSLFDATTIDYIIDLGDGVDYEIMVVKYKKKYNKNNGSYEIFHSSMEVK